jgi:hypothetical protein
MLVVAALMLVAAALMLVAAAATLVVAALTLVVAALMLVVAALMLVVAAATLGARATSSELRSERRTELRRHFDCLRRSGDFRYHDHARDVYRFECRVLGGLLGGCRTRTRPPSAEIVRGHLIWVSHGLSCTCGDRSGHSCSE